MSIQKKAARVPQRLDKLADWYTDDMPIAYTKMHGTGNQVLLVDQRADNLPPPDAKRLRELASPETGPGFDQLMWITAASKPDATAAYRVFNADGGEVEQCGNGVRCVALLLAGLASPAGDPKPSGEDRFQLECKAGTVEARILSPERVAVNMGRPEFDPAKIPFEADSVADRYEIEVEGNIYDVSVLSMGNPHCVLNVSDVDAAPVATLGPLFEGHSRFPARCNIGFMQLRDRQSINLRVYERGAGETQACGTGACAAVVAGQRMDRLDQDVVVHLPGGELVVSWRGDAEPVWLTGNAEWISEGTIDL